MVGYPLLTTATFSFSFTGLLLPSYATFGQVAEMATAFLQDR